MKAKSCLSNLISFYNKIIHLVNERKAMGVIFSYFSKAFDTIPHNVFLDRLSNCEMNRFMQCWVKNWLNGRAERVIVNGARSGWQPVTRSVTNTES